MKKIIISLMLLLVIPLTTPSIAQAQTLPDELKAVIDHTYNAEFEPAKTKLAQYIKANPTNPLGYLIQGTMLDWKQNILDLKGQYDEEILKNYEYANKVAFQQWHKDQDNLEKKVTLGNSYMYLSKKQLDMGKKFSAGGLLKKAKNYMEEVIEKDPKRFDAYMAMGIFNYYAANVPPGLRFLAKLIGMSGNERRGIKQLEKAASEPNPYQADARFVLTHIYSNSKKDFTNARTHINTLIKQYPQNPFFRLKKGIAAVEGKNDKVAEQAFKEYFTFCDQQPAKFCNQDFNYLANYFAGASRLRVKKAIQAKTFLEKAIQLEQNRHLALKAHLHFMYGHILKQEKNLAQAKQEFKVAVDLMNENKDIGRKAAIEFEKL